MTKRHPHHVSALSFALGFLLILIIGFVMFSPPSKEGLVTGTQVEFQTSDGVTIIGDLYKPDDPIRGAVLLLHMLPADRSSWKPLTEKIQAYNLAALAIDLRGHGESTRAGAQKLDYTEFADTDHQKSHADVSAALSYLTDTEKIPTEHIGVIGASIGANLALEAFANDHKLPWAVLLSPGLDYRGIETEQAITKLGTNQQVLLVASDNDLYALETIRRLHELAPSETKIEELKAAGHGTAMFSAHPDLVTDVLVWIKDHAASW